MRLFTAVELDDYAVSSVMKTVSELKKAGCTGNFSKKENLHITLNFIGETNDPKKARDCLRSVEFTPFDIRLSGIGSFRREGGDILWMGIDKCPPLGALQRRCTRALSGAGFVLENRPYSPHITLARRAVIPSYLPDAEPVVFKVKRFVLMESLRLGGQLIYRPFGIYDFGE